MVHNHIQCFNKAVECNPEIIVIRFRDMPIGEREMLTELCTALKSNAHTRLIPVLALLPAKHCRLMEDLVNAGVDFIRVFTRSELNPNLVSEIIDKLNSNDRIEQQLTTVCPYLNYKIMKARQEITVCGAYLDRLVLGGRRLHDLCQTVNYGTCEYFLKPRNEI